MRYDVVLLPLAAAAAMSFASPGRSQPVEPGAARLAEPAPAPGAASTADLAPPRRG